MKYAVWYATSPYAAAWELCTAIPLAMKLRAPGTSKSYVGSTPSMTNRFGLDQPIAGSTRL